MRELIAISAASLGVAFMVAIFGHPTWPGDVHTYFDYAFHWAVPQPNLYMRTPGFSIVLWATGVMSTGSLVGLYALQAVAGAAIPVLVYRALASISRAAALAASAVCVMSLIPYTGIKWFTRISYMSSASSPPPA
jgi:hypothetical protein